QPPEELAPSCAVAGVLGVLPGIVGLLQANEVFKLLLGVGETLAGRLLMFDAMSTSFEQVKVWRDPKCPACGEDSPFLHTGQSTPASPCYPGRGLRYGDPAAGYGGSLGLGMASDSRLGHAATGVAQSSAQSASIGHTPVVELRRISPNPAIRLFAKLEWVNP